MGHGLGGIGTDAEELDRCSAQCLVLGSISLRFSKLARHSNSLVNRAFTSDLSTHHPEARAATTISQNKSRMENRIRFRRLYFIGRCLRKTEFGLEARALE